MKSRAIPYEGNEPYIFLSYCHKDAAVVYPLLEQMVKDGYRIWYDDGNHVGDDWPENIANHLAKCSVCLVMMSDNSTKSHNCKSEITFATDCQKKMVTVLLEDFKPSLAIRMQIKRLNPLKRFELASDSALIGKICEDEAIKGCKDSAGASRLKELTEAEKKENDPAYQAQQQKEQEVQSQANALAHSLARKTPAADEKPVAEEKPPVAEKPAAEPVAETPAEVSPAPQPVINNDDKIQAMLAEIERLKKEQADAEAQAARDAERKAAERKEAEKKAAEEAARKEAERKAAEDAARQAAQRQAEEAAAAEDARIQAMLAEIERLRKAREEAARKAAEEEAARQEAARKAAEEAARREAERKAAEEAARKEAERKAAEEAARRAAMENDRIKAMLAEIERLKKEAEEAARLEAERIAKEQAMLRRRNAEAEARKLCDGCYRDLENLDVYKDQQAAARKLMEDAGISEEKKLDAEEFLLQIKLKERSNHSRIVANARNELNRLQSAAAAASGEAKELLLLQYRIVEEFANDAATQDSALDSMLSGAYRELEQKRKALAEKRAAEEAARKAAEEAARREAERKAAEEAARLEAERQAAVRKREQELMAELERLRAGLGIHQKPEEKTQNEEDPNQTIFEEDEGEVTVYGDPGEVTICGDPGDVTVIGDDDPGESTVVQPKPRNLAILLQPSAGKAFLLTATQTKLGRSPNHCDIVLDGTTSVSKHHADLILMNGKTFLLDAGSANGTYVGGERVNQGERHQLEEIALFKLADEALILLSGSAAMDWKNQDFIGLIMNEKRTSMMIVPEQGLPLNRYNKWPDGTLGDSKISRKEHAFVRHAADGIYLDDVSDPMKNGTYHNGRKMPNKTSVKLANSDTIRLGDTTLYPATISLKEI